MAPSSVFVSALSDEDMEPLRRALMHAASDRRTLTEVRLPLSDGALISELHRGGEVVDQRVDGDHLVLRARIPSEVAARLASAGAVVSPVRE